MAWKLYLLSLETDPGASTRDTVGSEDVRADATDAPASGVTDFSSEGAIECIFDWFTLCGFVRLIMYCRATRLQFWGEKAWCDLEGTHMRQRINGLRVSPSIRASNLAWKI